VLVGDAAHKMTPNLAYGFNTAFESATSLTNHLAASLAATSNDSRHPDVASINRAFSDYQKQRFARAKLRQDLANFYTRFAAWKYSLFKRASKLAPKVMADSVIVD
jgi:2-polyprenyl-6-methoxyphenol hydroxylase-like FAD-dependent oxidoreductase